MGGTVKSAEICLVSVEPGRTCATRLSRQARLGKQRRAEYNRGQIIVRPLRGKYGVGQGAENGSHSELTGQRQWLPASCILVPAPNSSASILPKCTVNEKSGHCAGRTSGKTIVNHPTSSVHHTIKNIHLVLSDPKKSPSI